MSILNMTKSLFISALMFYWFCISLLIHRFCTGYIRVPDFTRLIKKDHSAPTPYHWLAVPQQTMYQCVQFCYSFQLCKSLNFVRDEKVCSLFLATIGELRMLVQPLLHDYLDREHLSKELVGKCWNHECDVFSKCSEIDGHAPCVQVLEDRRCGYPSPLTFANATLESPVIPGSTVIFTCNPPYNGTLELMCSIDGSWTYYLYPYNYCRVDFCDMSFIRQTREPNMFMTTPDQRLFYTPVYCETGFDGVDWLIVQRRQNISLGFDQSEAKYVYGFEIYQVGIWLGTRKQFYLTDNYDLDLRVEFHVENDPTLYHAMYERFYVGANTTNFVLTIGQYIGGNCGDGLSYMDGFTFNVTMDDRRGWWDRDGCNGTNLNAEYNSPALKWATGCQDNTTSIWTDIVFTKMTVRRKKT